MRILLLTCLLVLCGISAAKTEVFHESLIYHVQARLKVLGYYKGELDAKWGQASSKALSEWEKNNYLKIDGVISKEDLKALLFIEVNPPFPTDFAKLEIVNRNNDVITVRYPADDARLKQPVEGLFFQLHIEKSDPKLILSYNNNYKMRLRLDGKAILYLSQGSSLKSLEATFAGLTEKSLKRRIVEICRLIGEPMFIYAVQDQVKRSGNQSLALKVQSQKEKLKRISLNCLSVLEPSLVVSKEQDADTEKVRELKLKLAALEIELKSLRTKFIKVAKENKEYSDKTAELQKIINDLSTNTSIDPALEEMLNERVENLKKELRSLESDFQAEKSEKNQLEKEFNNLASVLSDTQDQLTTLQNDNASSSQAISKLELTNEDLSAQLAEAAALITLLKAGATVETRDWKDVEMSLSLQQQRFCDILSNFRKDFSRSLNSSNQIKVNRTIMDRDENIDALLPKGQFDNWLGKIVEIYQTSELDAGYTIELQCGARFSTGQIDVDGKKKWVATAPQGSRIFNQLADLSKGQFVMVSGSMIKYADISEQTQTASYITKYEGDGAWTEWEQFFANSTDKEDTTVKLLDTENTDFMFFADMNYLSQY